MRKLLHFIGGEFVESSSQRCLPVFEPATGKIYAQVAAGNAQDAELALAAAERAQLNWSSSSSAARARYLNLIADALEQRAEEFAQAESLDCGKPISQVRTIEIPRAVQNFRFFAACLDTYGSEAYQHAGVGLHYTLRQALGPVVCISPWNLPLYLLSWKVAPALAFGNCVLAKPSEITPLTATLLAEVVRNIDLPAGVLNILQGTGKEIGAPLVALRGVKAVSFTGSTLTGSAIAQACAPQFKKTSLEMGGKNATIVFEDADFELAVRESVRAAYSNQGQICLCGSRIFVQRALIGRFRDAFIAQVNNLVLGDPAHPQTQLGALISAEHLAKVEAAIDTAHAEGGRLLLGGRRAKLEGRCAEGYFLEPTLFDQLPNACQSNQNEVFGPFATLIPFDDEQQVVLFANHSDYGLAASVFTQDLARAHRVAHALQTGLVWVNTWMQRDLRVPFGGVKNSGLGREGGMDAMRFFTEAKNITIAIPGV